MKTITIDGINYNLVPVEEGISFTGDLVGIIDMNKSEYPKILSFKGVEDPCKGMEFTLEENGQYRNGRNSYNSYIGMNDLLNTGHSVKTGHFVIHSVAKNKNEVFTVGDQTEQGKIRSFHYDNAYKGSIYAIFEGETRKSIINIYEAPERKPLFTTDDGKEIFEHCLLYNTCSGWTVGHMHSIDGYIDEGGVMPYVFSTKEAAEKYIRDNKPEFSRKQIKGAMNLAGNFSEPICVAKKLITDFYNCLGL